MDNPKNTFQHKEPVAVRSRSFDDMQEGVFITWLFCVLILALLGVICIRQASDSIFGIYPYFTQVGRLLMGFIGGLAAGKSALHLGYNVVVSWPRFANTSYFGSCMVSFGLIVFTFVSFSVFLIPPLLGIVLWIGLRMIDWDEGELPKYILTNEYLVAFGDSKDALKQKKISRKRVHVDGALSYVKWDWKEILRYSFLTVCMCILLLCSYVDYGSLKAVMGWCTLWIAVFSLLYYAKKQRRVAHQKSYSQNIVQDYIEPACYTFFGCMIVYAILLFISC